jgi:hypothetical protein
VGLSWLRTLLDLPSRDVALRHRWRQSRHGEVLGCSRCRSGAESYMSVSVVHGLDADAEHSPLLAPLCRICCEAARAESLHAAAIEAM